MVPLKNCRRCFTFFYISITCSVSNIFLFVFKTSLDTFYLYVYCSFTISPKKFWFYDVKRIYGLHIFRNICKLSNYFKILANNELSILIYLEIERCLKRSVYWWLDVAKVVSIFFLQKSVFWHIRNSRTIPCTFSLTTIYLDFLFSFNAHK